MKCCHNFRVGVFRTLTQRGPWEFVVMRCERLWRFGMFIWANVSRLGSRRVNVCPSLADSSID
jgi:hypothetical protein